MFTIFVYFNCRKIVGWQGVGPDNIFEEVLLIPLMPPLWKRFRGRGRSKLCYVYEPPPKIKP